MSASKASVVGHDVASRVLFHVSTSAIQTPQESGEKKLCGNNSLCCGIRNPAPAHNY